MYRDVVASIHLTLEMEEAKTEEVAAVAEAVSANEAALDACTHKSR